MATLRVAPTTQVSDLSTEQLRMSQKMQAAVADREKAEANEQQWRPVDAQRDTVCRRDAEPGGAQCAGGVRLG